jgi:zinc transporter ZupT
VSGERFLAAREITKVPLFAMGSSVMSWNIRLSAKSNSTTRKSAYGASFATTLVGYIRNFVEGMACVATNFHGRKGLWDDLLWQY